MRTACAAHRPLQQCYPAWPLLVCLIGLSDRLVKLAKRCRWLFPEYRPGDVGAVTLIGRAKINQEGISGLKPIIERASVG